MEGSWKVACKWLEVVRLVNAQALPSSLLSMCLGVKVLIPHFFQA